MTHDVIMPALGMAQETGLILAWHKQPGDAVKVGDILMEVETDKAAMEVEAQADGYVTELRAAEGEEVPVGTVIAVISADAENLVQAPAASAPEPSAATAQEIDMAPQVAPPTAEPAPPAQSSPAAERPANVARPADDRVLASPKAKRLAAEQGLDLNRLAKSGHPQPIRAADLARIENGLTQGNGAAGMPGRVLARASLPAVSFDEFGQWLAGEGAVATGAALAAFAAGSFRAVTGLDSLTVCLSSPRAPTRAFRNPDRCGLLAVTEEESESQADLIVYDLTASRLIEADLAATDAPAVTVSRSQDNLTVTLSATRDQFDDQALIAMLDAFAGCLEDPLRQLL